MPRLLADLRQPDDVSSALRVAQAEHPVLGVPQTVLPRHQPQRPPAQQARRPHEAVGAAQNTQVYGADGRGGGGRGDVTWSADG